MIAIRTFTSQGSKRKYKYSSDFTILQCGGRNGDQNCDKQWCPKEKRNQLSSVIIVSVPVVCTTMERPQGGAEAA